VTKPAFSGRQRKRTTRLGVRVGERVARVVITVGGIGTIVSVGLIMVFLASVVLPLFKGARVGPEDPVAALVEDGAPIAQLAVDEYANLVAVVRADGGLAVRRMDTGDVLERRALFEEAPTAQAWSEDGTRAAFGFADGTVRLASLAFQPSFLGAEEEGAFAGLRPGELATDGTGIVERTAGGELRRQAHAVALQDPLPIAGEPIALLDFSTSGRRTVICTLTAGAKLRLYEVSEKKNMLTGAVTYRTESAELPFAPPPDLGGPLALVLSGSGDQVLVVWPAGEAVRIDARDREAPAVAEHVDLVPAEGERVTALAFMPGKNTLVVGDSAGGLTGWFTVKPEGADTVDGALLLGVHVLAERGAPVTALAPSTRSRLLLAGRADGAIELYQMTTEVMLAAVRTAGGAAVEALDLLPKEDGLACAAGGRLERFSLDPRYPEAGFRALFAPVWYEGDTGPKHVWQSSGGTDDFEPKLGLVPLVFGTIKATFYSLLFGAPIALLAAIYTSEFLHRRFRTPVKSVIEIMASLPSVVLGFLAALVIAPFVQSVLPGVLALFLTVPLSLLFGAHVWQMLPRPLTVRLEGGPRLFVIAGALLASVGLAAIAGPAVARAVFGGDIELWLDGQAGQAFGGWLFLLLPLAALVVVLLMGSLVEPLFRVKSAGWSHATCAAASFVKFACGTLAAGLLALAGASALQGAGLDPRSDLFGLVGTYVQRNALVVGFVMGFAVIPIIYTLAEDALSSVPEHLRHASLGAGATPWQTAMRVVVPTAMSGLFSALMIGLGRAVGETMIVLMATGNTAIMDMNVFNGFRTLSANIAVELPEAVKDSTHYRTLFLAALVLFAMTFVLNTLAEIVRQRFRKRAVQL
jgi:phosphate transport system permease protein